MVYIDQCSQTDSIKLLSDALLPAGSSVSENWIHIGHSIEAAPSSCMLQLRFSLYYTQTCAQHEQLADTYSTSKSKGCSNCGQENQFQKLLVCRERGATSIPPPPPQARLPASRDNVSSHPRKIKRCSSYVTAGVSSKHYPLPLDRLRFPLTRLTQWRSVCSSSNANDLHGFPFLSSN